jgi:hypothetical protein
MCCPVCWSRRATFRRVPGARSKRTELKNSSEYRTRAAKVVVDSHDDRLLGMVMFNWDALDAWFEEDEQIFVHPRNPNVRVDAIRIAWSYDFAVAAVVPIAGLMAFYNERVDMHLGGHLLERPASR